jgi:DNA-binding NarL/FixJ family response regulator
VTASHSRVDLVIVSLTMPEEERREAIRAIEAQWPQVKTIAMAGTLGPATLRAADLLGAQAVITKTMASKSVLRHVREALRARPVAYSAGEDAQPVPLNRPIQR